MARTAFKTKHRRAGEWLTEEQVEAVADRLEAALAEQHPARDLLPEAYAALVHVMKRMEHSQQWYAERHATLFDWAHRELNETQKTQYFNIVANGTPSAADPPTYAQQFNRMKWRAEKAEAELAALREQVAKQDTAR